MSHVKPNGKLSYNASVSPYTFEAYFVAKWGDRKIWDNVISIHTGWMPWNWGTPNVMHVEGGVIADRKLWFFSATSRDYLNPAEVDNAKPGNAVYFKNGTRWISAKELLKNPDRWIITVKKNHMTGNKQRIIRANGIVGKAYDFVGVVFDFLFPWDLYRIKEKWYCSKAWHFVDRSVVQRISPRRRYRLATTKYGYKRITLEELLKYCHGKF